MKLGKRTLALLLAAAMVMCLFAGCASKPAASDDAPAKATEAKTTEAQTEAQAPAAEDSKKSILYYVAYIGDFGMWDMGYRAASAAAEKYGYDLTLVEYGTDTSAAVNSLVDALDTKHYDYVLCAGWYVSDTIIEKSANGEWSDITFIMFDTSPVADFGDTDNIYGISFAQNEGSFLVAVYSALMSKTGKIGCTINLDAPITNDFGAGWLCGYKYANKELGMDLDMMYAYLGEMTVQNNYETVSVMIDNGCDYIYDVAGDVCLGALQAADEKSTEQTGRYILGTDYDQYSYYRDLGSAKGYQTLITSMLKNVEPCVALLFENLNSGNSKILPGNTVYGLSTDGVGLAENENYLAHTPEDVQNTMRELTQKIISGEIDVVSYYDFNSYEAFAAYRDNPDADFAA